MKTKAVNLNNSFGHEANIFRSPEYRHFQCKSARAGFKSIINLAAAVYTCRTTKLVNNKKKLTITK